MRTTWSRVLMTGTLAASGLPGLMSTTAVAQGYAGGMAAPATTGSPYPTLTPGTAPAPYDPAASPYTANSAGLGGGAAAPAAVPYSPPARVTASPGGVPAYSPNAAVPGSAPSYYNPNAAVPGSAPTYNPGAAVPGRTPSYNPSATVPGSAPAYNPGATVPGRMPPYRGAAVPGSAPSYNPGAVGNGMTSPYMSATAPYGSATGGRAVAPATAPNYVPRAAVTGGGVMPGRNGPGLPGAAGSDPSGMRASYLDAPAEAAAAAPSMRGRGAGSSAFASDTLPYPPPPKPSRMRRFYNWLTGDDKTADRPVHTYIDPSTGRTDLPMSKPWLKQVW
ncbi:MAG: hypothetical protein P4L84_11440 [Isosphaeraceae bacterium]|nr:hypothetical protein [Isosphaeraceae bacterium]